MNDVLRLARPDILELQPYQHAAWNPELERLHANEMPWRAAGDAAVTTITFEDMPPVAAELDVAALKAAILDSQQRGQKYRDFIRRAIAAGVQGYFAFLRGKRVTYFGRTGDQHTEWFPGAGPGKD